VSLPQQRRRDHHRLRYGAAVGSEENLDDPHDVDNLYQWGIAAGGSRIGPDGSAFTSFLATLNDCGLPSVEDGEATCGSTARPIAARTHCSVPRVSGAPTGEGSFTR
jgi:hypothetical protein